MKVSFSGEKILKGVMSELKMMNSIYLFFFLIHFLLYLFPIKNLDKGVLYHIMCNSYTYHKL